MGRLQHGLKRFADAQNSDYEVAKKELMSGKKVSHWMWYIFPQIRGLGKSYDSDYYGIADLEEAKAYYEDPILGERLLCLCNILLKLEEKDVNEIFTNDIDVKKLRSSMTLFYEASKDEIFMKVLDKYFHGEEDEKTLLLLNKKQ